MTRESNRKKSFIEMKKVQLIHSCTPVFKGVFLDTRWYRLRADKRTVKQKPILSGGTAMKGYFTESGYMGYVDGRYVLFACEKEYFEFAEER